MMVVGLLLAQIVQSWPGLDSPLVQPPGMICLGACAGPVVWGPAERGRLVVACDMRSDTCSDGRKIATERATPVPCETSPGGWEMVPEDTGCYSVRGLEAWAATTSYLAYGAELDNPAWIEAAGGTVEVLPDGYRIRPAPGSNNSGVTQSGVAPISPGGETRTLACIVRTHRPAYIRFWVGGSQSVSFPVVDTGGRWEVLSATREIPDTSGSSVRIGGGPPRSLLL